MYKMTVTYEDFNGDEHTEDVYFNLSKIEILQIYASKPGKNGIATYLEKIVKAGDNKEIVDAFTWFVELAYGERSDDGTRFIKKNEKGERLVDLFKQTGAYDAVMWKLATDTNAASDFISHILPEEELRKAVAQVTAADGAAPIMQMGA